MTYWPWWQSGLALTFVMVIHWLGTGRLMAVSGRFTALVNRVRHGEFETEPQLSEAELVALLRDATADEFGTEALAELEAGPVAAPALDVPPPRATLPPRTLGQHLVFLGALLAGGFIAAQLHGGFALSGTLNGAGFAALSGSSPWLSSALLLCGGLLVGFGTRMAGGCTSGHGLCGVSRLQKGSLVATAAFFGTGIATALLLG